MNCVQQQRQQDGLRNRCFSIAASRNFAFAMSKSCLVLRGLGLVYKVLRLRLLAEKKVFRCKTYLVSKVFAAIIVLYSPQAFGGPKCCAV